MGKATLSPTSARLCGAAGAVGIQIHQGLGAGRRQGTGLRWGRAEQEDKRKRKLSLQSPFPRWKSSPRPTDQVCWVSASTDPDRLMGAGEILAEDVEPVLCGIPGDGPFVAEAGRLPSKSRPLGIVLFLPESLGKSIFVEMLS